MLRYDAVMPDAAYDRLVGAIEEYCDLTGEPRCNPFLYAGYSNKNPQCNLSAIKRRCQFPRTSKFAMICEYVRVSPDWVLGYSESDEYEAQDGVAAEASRNFNELYIELTRRYKGKELGKAFGIHQATVSKNALHSGADRSVKTVMVTANALGLTFEQVTGMRGPDAG